MPFSPGTADSTILFCQIFPTFAHKKQNMANIILNTTRCYLREITADDAAIAYELNADPQVIQYTGDEAFESIAAARQFLTQYDHYRRYGFGRWGVIRRDDGAFLGWCGLKYTAEDDEFDIGFRFFRRYWNQAYATETAKACLHLGFMQLDISVIVGRVMAANCASIRVLEKIGLQYQTDFDFDGQLGYLYSLDKATYIASLDH